MDILYILTILLAIIIIILVLQYLIKDNNKNKKSDIHKLDNIHRIDTEEKQIREKKFNEILRIPFKPKKFGPSLMRLYESVKCHDNNEFINPKSGMKFIFKNPDMLTKYNYSNGSFEQNYAGKLIIIGHCKNSQNIYDNSVSSNVCYIPASDNFMFIYGFCSNDHESPDYNVNYYSHDYHPEHLPMFSDTNDKVKLDENNYIIPSIKRQTQYTYRDIEQLIFP